MKVIEIDATNQSLGRLASKVATALRGKDTAAYDPRIIPNSQVVISNIDKIKFTGDKKNTVVFHHYSGFPGGLHSRTLEMAWAKNPQEVVRHAIKGMLPVNRQRDVLMRHLKFK